MKSLEQALTEAYAENQNQPNQFVISYHRMDNDEFIGYHYDTFCHIGDDILMAKRYGGDPIEQLKVVTKNIALTLDKAPSGPFAKVYEQVQSQFNNLKSKDIWLNYIPLCDGTPAQNKTFKLL